MEAASVVPTKTKGVAALVQGWGSENGVIHKNGVSLPLRLLLYCLLPSSAITVESEVPFGSTTEVKIARMCFMSPSNELLRFTTNNSTPAEEMVTVIVPVQSGLTV